MTNPNTAPSAAPIPRACGPDDHDCILATPAACKQRGCQSACRDAGGAASGGQGDTEQEKFEYAFRHCALTKTPDAWGQPAYAHSHVRALWDGWAACADRSSTVPAEVEKDAARYQWLRGHVGEIWAGNGFEWAAKHDVIDHPADAASLDAAVDAAITASNEQTK